MRHNARKRTTVSQNSSSSCRKICRKSCLEVWQRSSPLFDSLTRSLDSVFVHLRKRGSVGEAELTQAKTAIRRALLEADVSVEAVKVFFDAFAPRVEELKDSIRPAEELLERAQKALARLLGEGVQKPLRLAFGEGSDPPCLLVVGLQGSGKTTSAVKLAARLQEEKHTPLLVSLDFSRPAAEEQMTTLAFGASLPVLPRKTGETMRALATRARTESLQRGALLIADTAGRMQIDEQAMSELEALAELLQPRETWLVADAMLGQEAANIAHRFRERVDVSGVLLTRMDSDARAGAALSIAAAIRRPIRFAGTGEGTGDLEPFLPQSLAGRILGRGDLTGLAETMRRTAPQTSKPSTSKSSTSKPATSVASGKFDLNAQRAQIRQMRSAGGVKGLARHLPQAVRDKLEDARMKSMVDDDKLKRQEVIIDAMTPFERRNPAIIHASRKRRIAAGASASVVEVNRLLKTHAQAAKTMKKMARWDEKVLQRNMMNLFRQ